MWILTAVLARSVARVGNLSLPSAMRLRLSLLLFVAACRGSPEPVQADLSLPAQVTLRTGEQRTVQGLTIRFVGVKADSRCPDNARCVWAGNASVELRFEGGGDSVFVVLNTEVDPKNLEVHGLRVRIESLMPYPRVGEPAANTHDLTLHVESTR